MTAGDLGIRGENKYHKQTFGSQRTPGREDAPAVGCLPSRIPRDPFIKPLEAILAVAFEVELKFRLLNPEDFRSRLGRFSPRALGEQTQADVYFRHPARDFARTDEALRIRQTNDRLYVTYKGPKIDKATKTRKEIELEFAAGTELASAWELLRSLGFSDVLTVNKRRWECELLHAGRSFHVSLDEVERLGSFVEIESIAAEAQLDSVRAAIVDLARELGFDPLKTERRSYLEMLLELS